jgi:hypothetical protein
MIERLVGVYNAEGTLRGEVAYWIGARLGRAHCALCDITHGLLSERAEWRQCRDGLPVLFDTYHLDDQPDAVRLASDGQAPVVLAESAGGELVVLLGADELDRCDGSVERLSDAISVAVERSGLLWPTGVGGGTGRGEPA